MQNNKTVARTFPHLQQKVCGLWNMAKQQRGPTRQQYHTLSLSLSLEKPLKIVHINMYLFIIYSLAMGFRLGRTYDRISYRFYWNAPRNNRPSSLSRIYLFAVARIQPTTTATLAQQRRATKKKVHVIYEYLISVCIVCCVVSGTGRLQLQRRAMSDRDIFRQLYIFFIQQCTCMYISHCIVYYTFFSSYIFEVVWILNEITKKKEERRKKNCFRKEDQKYFIFGNIRLSKYLRRRELINHTNFGAQGPVHFRKRNIKYCLCWDGVGMDRNKMRPFQLNYY